MCKFIKYKSVPTCIDCPIEPKTETAHNIINHGYLPSYYDVLAIKKETDRTWACHEDHNKPCRGALQAFKENGLSHNKDKPLFTEEEY